MNHFLCFSCFGRDNDPKSIRIFTVWRCEFRTFGIHEKALVIQLFGASRSGLRKILIKPDEFWWFRGQFHEINSKTIKKALGFSLFPTRESVMSENLIKHEENDRFWESTFGPWRHPQKCWNKLPPFEFSIPLRNLAWDDQIWGYS